MTTNNQPLKSSITTQLVQTNSIDLSQQPLHDSSLINQQQLPTDLKLSTNQAQTSQTQTGSPLQIGSLANQLCPLGPKDRCTPSQAQAMGQQILSLIMTHENNKLPMPCE